MFDKIRIPFLVWFLVCFGLFTSACSIATEEAELPPDDLSAGTAPTSLETTQGIVSTDTPAPHTQIVIPTSTPAHDCGKLTIGRSLLDGTFFSVHVHNYTNEKVFLTHTILSWPAGQSGSQQYLNFLSFGGYHYFNTPTVISPVTAEAGFMEIKAGGTGSWEASFRNLPEGGLTGIYEATLTFEFLDDSNCTVSVTEIGEPFGMATPVQVAEKLRFGRGIANQVAYSPDGEMLAVAGGIGVWLYNAETGTPERLLEVPENTTCVAWDPQGEQLALGTDQGSIWIWELESSEARLKLKHGPTVLNNIVWSLNGEYLASGGEDGTVKVWDPSTGEENVRLNVGTTWATHVAWSPDGNFLLTGGVSDWVNVHEVGSWKDAFSLNVYYVPAAQELQVWTQNIEWSPRGDLLAANLTDGTLFIWETENFELVKQFQFGYDGSPFLSWSPDGSKLAVLYEGVQILDVESWSVVDQWHQETPDDYFAWSPDGTQMAIVRQDGGAVKIWDFETNRKSELSEGPTTVVRSVAWSPDGNQLASGYSDGKLRIWDVANESITHVIDAHSNFVSDLAWSPEGSLLASVGWCEERVPVWDVDDGELSSTIGDFEDVTSVDWSPGGSQLAIGTADGTARVWNVDSRQISYVLRIIVEENTSIYYPVGGYVAWRPNWGGLASLHPLGAVLLWDVERDGGALSRIYDCGRDVAEIAWSRNGDKLVCGIYRMRVIDRYSGLVDFEISGLGATWSPTVDWLAVWTDDTMIRVYLSPGMEELFAFHAHNGPITSAAWSSNGKYLATGSTDGTVRIWNMDQIWVEARVSD